MYSPSLKAQREPEQQRKRLALVRRQRNKVQWQIIFEENRAERSVQSPIPSSGIHVKLHSGDLDWLRIEPFLECVVLKLIVLGIVCHTGFFPKYNQQDLDPEDPVIPSKIIVPAGFYPFKMTKSLYCRSKSGS